MKRCISLAAAASLALVVLFAVAMHWPVFREGKTISAFDIAYAFGAYADVKPAGFVRASNGLLSDPVVQFQAWDVAMFDGPLRFPWLWNPDAGFGSPLLANSQAAPLFPLKHLVYPLVGPRAGFGVVCFLKMLLAGLLMWSYLGALRLDAVARAVGALAFMGCGFMVVWLQWPHTSVALSLPLLALGAERLFQGERRRGFWILAAGSALGALAGHPETLFHICFSVGLYLVARVLLQSRETPADSRARLAPTLTWFVAAGVLGALLAALQLAPTAEYLLNSQALGQRSEAQRLAHAAGSVFSLENASAMRDEFLTYLLPDTFGNPSRHTHWWNKSSNYNESAGYVGIGTLLLALFGWRYLRRSPPLRALFVLQVIALGFSVRAPLVDHTLGALPLFTIAANKRFLLVFCFSNAAMAALAVHEWRRAARWSRADVIWLGAVGGFLALLAGQRYFGTFARHPQAWIHAYGKQELLHFAAFLVLTVAALVLMRAPRRRLTTAAAVALPLFVAADIHLVHYRYNPFVRPDTIYPTTPAMTFLKSRETPRVLPIGTHIGPNILSAYGIEDPRMYDAVTYGPLAGYLAAMQAVSVWSVVRTAPSPLTSVAGIRYLWASPDWKPASGSVRQVFAAGGDRIYEDPQARPAAYLTPAWTAVASPEAALNALSTQDAAGTLTVLEGPPPAPTGAAPAAVQAAQVFRESPSRVRVELPGQGGGLLVLNDCYYPGWTAAVDGRPVGILRANGTFRGVLVPAGSRTVSFHYAPRSFTLGALISALALALAGLLARRWSVTPQMGPFQRP
jgi:hypothetical protein